MAEYCNICKRCIHPCKQRSDLGTKVVKCPEFEEKSTSRGDREASASSLPKKN